MKTSRQLNDLIKNAANKSGINAQILQKRYFMERFIERVSLSDYRGKFILKGGILISALAGIGARSTMDIDITVRNMPLNENLIKAAVKEIIAIDPDDSVNFSFRKIESIREEADYDCYRISLDVAFDKVRDNIRIDITAGDVITPQEIKFGYETMLDKKRIELYSYNIETVMAEKIETILSRGVLNTRMRDFYDCYLLDSLHGDNVDKAVFRAALKATVSKRKSEIIFVKAPAIIEELKASAELRKLWDAYTKTFPYAREVEFADTIKAVEKYMAL